MDDSAIEVEILSCKLFSCAKLQSRTQSQADQGTENCKDSSYEMGICVTQANAGRGSLSGDKA